MDLFREAPGVPVLGVCLGMQALALAHGAAVVRAPEPVHGRLSAVAPPATRCSPAYPQVGPAPRPPARPPGAGRAPGADAAAAAQAAS